MVIFAGNSGSIFPSILSGKLLIIFSQDLKEPEDE
jgi:hypothetical protein